MYKLIVSIGSVIIIWETLLYSKKVVKKHFKQPSKKNIKMLSTDEKKKVAGLQQYKCANKPGSNLARLEKYNCPLWQLNNGSFDISGYEIDHIKERHLGGSNDLINLQALCKMCHGVKTHNFNIERKGE